MNHEFKPGDCVVFSRQFLRSTGQFTGAEAPTSWGPFARGHVASVEAFTEGKSVVAVRWADGVTLKALNVNLIHAADRSKELS